MRARRLSAAVCAIAVGALAGGCGFGLHDDHNADSNSQGIYVHAGPVTYQLQVSRELDPYSPEDSGYLAGLSKKEATLSPSQLWFGVFLWAKNETNRTQMTTNNFDIVDTEGHIYRPLHLSPSANPYIWYSMPLAPGATEPNGDTTAGYGPTGGRLLLFKLPALGTLSVYNNRPLTLQIRGNTNKVWGTISLDL